MWHGYDERISVVLHSDKWSALVNTVMNNSVSIKSGSYLLWMIIRFSAYWFKGFSELLFVDDCKVLI